MKIYVAGAYSADTVAGKLHNTELAMDAGIALIQKGHIAYIPHTTHFLDQHARKHGITLPNTFWYDYDMHFMVTCFCAGFYLEQYRR